MTSGSVEEVLAGGAAKTGASLNRGRSKQDYGTPRIFLDAVEKRFGRIRWDLAAHKDNAVCSWFYGPRSLVGEDAFGYDWKFEPDEEGPQTIWLNPPFENISPWAEKCATRKDREGFLLLLTPASVGTDWFRVHVQPNAYVLGLSPRLTFEGTTAPYPKDLMLSVFGYGLHGFDVWRWK